MAKKKKKYTRKRRTAIKVGQLLGGAVAFGYVAPNASAQLMAMNWGGVLPALQSDVASLQQNPSRAIQAGAALVATALIRKAMGRNKEIIDIPGVGRVTA